MSNETLKFPSGEFTHTELAKLNGKTNQQVWTRYQAAIKSGQIVSAGERKSAGKGKPSRLWKLDPTWVAPVVPVSAAPSPVTPPAPAIAPVNPPVETTVAETITPAPAIVPEVTTPAPAIVPEVIVSEAVVETPAAEVAASIPPVIIAEVTPVVTPEVTPEVAETVVPNIMAPARANTQLADARTLTETCPVCNHPLLAINDATGVMVWCGQGIEICSSTENPYGHGKNEKDAIETLNTKWARATASTAA